MKLRRILVSLVCSVFVTLTASSDEPIHAVFLIHEREYISAETVPAFAKAELEDKLGWKCSFVIGDRPNQLNGTEVLESADLLFVSVRRQAIPEKQMAPIRAYIEAGKPVVGIRTASHAWTVKKEVPTGVQWIEFDADVLGGNYNGHYPKDLTPDVSTVWSTEEIDHPIMSGVSREKWSTTSWHYKVRPLAETATPLMWGQYLDNEPEPVAWTNVSKYGGKVFYTSLGHPDDFESKEFRQMLVNGMRWTVGNLTDNN
jgi:type 1 glutamine amidotransferase